MEGIYEQLSDLLNEKSYLRGLADRLQKKLDATTENLTKQIEEHKRRHLDFKKKYKELRQKHKSLKQRFLPEFM
jgi:predicted  nucleic acid-binding Zn-ribbon protein